MWEEVRVGNICEVVAGQSPAGKFYNTEGNGLAFYQGKKDFGVREIKAPTKWTTQITKEAKAGDILMSVRAPVGPINIATQKICIGRGLAAIRPSNKIYRDFLYYGFLAKQDEISGSEGAVFASINKSQIGEIKIPLPCLEEQKRIVAILDEAFAGIDKAIENTEKNLANAKELFESYLNNIFTQKGDGWVEKKLGDDSLLKIIDGDRGTNYPKKSDFLDRGFCLFLNTKNVRPDGFNFDTKMFITEKKDNLLRKGKLERRDVLLTTRGTIGNIAIYDSGVEFDEIRINSGMLIFRPNEKVIVAEYLFEILRSGIMKSQIKKHVSGAAQPQLPIKTLVDFTIPVPKKLTDQRKIVLQLQELLAETKRLENKYRQKLSSLQELKQSLLQKAFAGELTADMRNVA